MEPGFEQRIYASAGGRIYLQRKSPQRGRANKPGRQVCLRGICSLVPAALDVAALPAAGGAGCLGGPTVSPGQTEASSRGGSAENAHRTGRASASGVARKRTAADEN